MPGIMCQLPPGKVNHFGIEASSGITWTGWEPGREYTKNIVLKNIKARPTKIKYKTPSSRYFTTLYPQPIALSAGNSFVLPITFRPLEKTVYEDRMEFVSSEGSFVVPMKAVLPQYDIQAPETFHVGLCAVADCVQAKMEIRNCSELVSSYQVECAEPFSVLPSEGIIEPFASTSLLIAFKPKAALVSDVDLVISFGQDFSQSRIVRLRGIGKYPHLSISAGATSSRTCGELESELIFGQVFVGQTVQKWIEISNQSPVNAAFHVEHPLTGPTQVEQVFHCAQKNGVVPALSSIKIPFSFSPTTIGQDCVDYFYIQANGTPSKIVVRCIGFCKGPSVCLSQDLVNFKKADSGEVLTRPLEIINETSVEATFQFQIDCAESVFKFDTLTGTLAPNSRKMVLVHFAPLHPINYYRRVACVIHNQGVLFLDLLGTCHTEVDKPAILHSCHIRRYRIHVERGLSLKAPEQLNMMFAEGQLVVDDSGALTLPSQVGNISAGEGHNSPVRRSSAEFSPSDEYVNDGYHSEVVVYPPHVSADVHQVDFGRVTDLNNFEHQIVSLTNHTQGKICVVWTGDPSRVFSVTPMTADVLPQKSSVFKVAFRPDGPNKFFGSELECFAFYKSMRDYRLTDDKTHFPPWCITLTATGNTFQLNNEFFIPRIAMNPRKLSFSVISANDASYRTLLLTNAGTTPIMFDFEKESTGTFLLKPTKGLLAPSANQIFVLKFRPTNEKKTYKDTLRLRLNHVDKHTQSIMIYGKVELPQLLLDNSGSFYFKPTCTGTVSHRIYGIKNLSRVPVYFEWRLRSVDSQVLKVDPIGGLIKPNEKQFHKWFFKPTTEEKYVMKPVLLTWSQLDSTPGRKIPFPVRAIGAGSYGQLVCQEKCVDCGPLVVGTVTDRHITLANESLCNLSYKLHISQNISGPYSDEDLYQDGLALELSEMEGTISARTKLDMTVSMRPLKRVTYQWDISYSILTIEGERIALSEMRPLCRVTATGIFPTMVVTDARCHGSASGLSKKQLWSLFCLDNFNMFLDGDPATEELKYKVPTKHSLSRKAPVHTRAIIDFNFSSAPVGSEPCVVQLMLENNGAAACEWSFLYPTDLQLELEYWAETGEYDADELHEMKILENKLFSIEPKKGKLEQGEHCTVTLAYRHTMVGTDRLPVLLKLSYGREILLNFVGVTVEADRRYIHFPSTRFMFAPVPIGETRGPTQVYEMYNGGAVPVQFEIDTFPLRALMQDNYVHPIFECLNQKGEIQPGHTTVVEWKFSPLEARTYSVDVAIKIECGETAIITFTGVGFDKRLLGDTMPITDQLDQSKVPSVQSVPSPGQLCFLNQERISFGNMPLYTRGRRAIVMTNRSKRHSASFTWHVTNERDAQYLTIYPISGSLNPGESAMFKATFIAIGIPAFYDVDLVCEVINLTEQREYERTLSDWESECRRQTVEFTITEKDPNADQHISTTECALEDGRPGSGKLQSLENGRTVSPESAELLRYKTLPPISKNWTCDDKRLNEKLKRRFDEKFWPKPTKPKSFLLHLGLTVRTHDIVEFQQHFPQDYKKFFIDRTIFEMHAMPSAQELQEEQVLSPKPVCCNQKEADMLALALSSIIRSLLDDTGFHEACHGVMEEPIPYFQQFCPSKPSSEKSPSATDVPPSTDLRMTSREVASPYANEELQPKKDENRLTTDESVRHDSHGSSQRSSKMNFMTPTPQAGSSSPSPRNQPVSCGTGTGDQSPMQDANTPDLFPEGVFGNSEERDFMLKQRIKKLPGVCSEVESVLENTLMNIVQEAFHQEFNITARPRLVALPPRPIHLGNEKKGNGTKDAKC